LSRIIAPPTFGLIYELGHDAPWYAGAAMIALAVPLALQIAAKVYDRTATSP
jgi:hypothetical protein